MSPNPQKTPDLVTFTEVFLNKNLHFLSSACKLVSLTETTKTAEWTNFSKFWKFYFKPVNDINFTSNISNGLYKIL